MPSSNPHIIGEVGLIVRVMRRNLISMLGSMMVNHWVPLLHVMVIC